MRDAINIIWRLAVLAELILAARLYVQGLWRDYLALFAGSTSFALQGCLFMWSVHHVYSKSPMQIAWKITEPLVWVLWSWIVLELFSKWTRSYRGIGRFGRILFGVCIVVALLVSLAAWPYEWKALVLRHDFRIYYIISRVIMATLALFTLMVWLFFRNYPTPVAPNVVRHTVVTLVYLGANTLGWLTDTLSGTRLTALVNLSTVVFAVGCSSAWAILLTRKGEAKESVPILAPEEIAKIERINRELLVFMRQLPSEVGVGEG